MTTPNTASITCPACQAAPGMPHSLACDNPEEFERQELQRQMLEDDARATRVDLEEARGAVASAMNNVRRIAPRLIAAGYSEVKAADMLGIDRMTLRKVLGKQ